MNRLNPGNYVIYPWEDDFEVGVVVEVKSIVCLLARREGRSGYDNPPRNSGIPVYIMSNADIKECQNGIVEITWSEKIYMSAIIEEIKACTTMQELDAIRPDVIEFFDNCSADTSICEDVRNAFRKQKNKIRRFGFRK